ncbi:hypothetical protein PoB_000099100 [Plakobranchus ocellatus]|uniref:Uncharacterized protein n=1 Tax=Plakobranchus ocellatus TaxID=259542 RepID=A0AAV3XWP6_9GAST|nr:hypothetical protein PoB_000099100 [Plakobranchus ocellatus]
MSQNWAITSKDGAQQEGNKSKLGDATEFSCLRAINSPFSTPLTCEVDHGQPEKGSGQLDADTALCGAVNLSLQQTSPATAAGLANHDCADQRNTGQGHTDYERSGYRRRTLTRTRDRKIPVDLRADLLT